MSNKIISTPIFPIRQTFDNKTTKKLVDWSDIENYNIDCHAIAIFCSLGFILKDDTCFRGIKTFMLLDI